MQLAQLASHSYENLKTQLQLVLVDDLKSLDFALMSLPRMIHQKLNSDSMQHKSMDADTLRWLIQRELDKRQAGELPYTWTQMYKAMGIPKEFLY
jgi:hypothetical protein